MSWQLYRSEWHGPVMQLRQGCAVIPRTPACWKELFTHYVDFAASCLIYGWSNADCEIALLLVKFLRAPWARQDLPNSSAPPWSTYHPFIPPYMTATNAIDSDCNPNKTYIAWLHTLLPTYISSLSTGKGRLIHDPGTFEGKKLAWPFYTALRQNAKNWSTAILLYVAILLLYPLRTLFHKVRSWLLSELLKEVQM